MSVTPEEVRRIAALARLRLDAREVQEMSLQLSSILDHMEALRQVEIGSVEPMASVTDRTAPLREDRGAPDALQRPPAELAPEWAEPFFTVPRLAALDAGPPPERSDG